VRTFDYARAATLDDALALVGRDGSAALLAGGTDLVPLMKLDVEAPARLVDIKRVGELAAGIHEDGDALTLGALTPLTDLESDALIRERYTALAQATALAASPQVRNMATLGGNLLQRPRCWYFRNPHVQCWLKDGERCPARDGENQQHALFASGPCVAVHPSDPASALLALDAEVVLRSGRGTRRLPLAELFAEPTDARRTETVLGSDELVMSVSLPRPAPGTRSVYLKAMDRKVWSFALVGVAAVLRTQGRLIVDARLVLTGVAPIPWRARTAEQALLGAEAAPETFERAAELALADAQPLSHNGYKVRLARAMIRRALGELYERASA
jgi:xanthine dehydrogenase YagS FAD-binding subunit